MTDRPNTVKRIAEQNRKNIKAIAEQLDAGRHLENGVGADWTKTFGLRDGEKETKSEEEKTADLLAENAENIVRLAEAIGVRESKIHGKATKADWTKTFGLAPEGGDP